MPKNLSDFTDEQLIEEIKNRGYKVAGVTIKAINKKSRECEGAKSLADDFCSQFDDSFY